MYNDIRLQKRSIKISDTIISALKQMDREKTKLLFVFSDEIFVGMLTIGDIQRAILNSVDLNNIIDTILDHNKIYAHIGDSLKSIKQKMQELRAEAMPVLDAGGSIIDIYYWSDLWTENQKRENEYINLPVVIMAGGKGTRLKPLTNIYPKPLIPIGEKTVIETIMDKFLSYDCHDFYISVNYKAGMIKNYFSYLNNDAYHITYFQENKPMGTAGSLRLLKDSINSTFFVSNCDTLIDEDYASILEYHRNNHNELTVVAALKTYSIPYGTIKTGSDGILEGVDEKPTLTFKVNTGLYILEPTVFDDIPDDFFHITHLMDKLHQEGRRVGIYPISQNDWTDMGDWDEYLKLVRR